MKIMKWKRRKFDAALRAKVTIEALKEWEILLELAVRHDLHPNQISQWEQDFLENSCIVFEQKGSDSKREPDIDVGKPYSKIRRIGNGKWLSKKSLVRLDYDRL